MSYKGTHMCVFEIRVRIRNIQYILVIPFDISIEKVIDNDRFLLDFAQHSITLQHTFLLLYPKSSFIAYIISILLVHLIYREDIFKIRNRIEILSKALKKRNEKIYIIKYYRIRTFSFQASTNLFRYIYLLTINAITINRNIVFRIVL